MAAAPVYLDFNATTPLDKEVAEAVKPYLEQYFGNPSSSHMYGLETKSAVETARKNVSTMLGSFPDEVVFTSCGTESNNFALKGFVYAHRHRGDHIITQATEHPAVIEVCKYLETQGFKVSYLGVDEDGRVSAEAVAAAITDRTILVSVMLANNETGVVQPVAEIAAAAHKRGVAVHTDAAQAVGKIPVRVDELGVDLLSIACHKMYAPKGVGLLYIRRGTVLEKLLHGAGHEHNRRAGTENVVHIVGVGRAAELVSRHLERYAQQMRETRDALQRRLEESGLDLRVNGKAAPRLPNTLSVSFRGVEANTLLSEVSPVLAAMRLPVEYAMGTCRFSTGRATTHADIERAADVLIKAVQRLQKPAASPDSTPGGADDCKLTAYTHGLGCACKLRPQALEKVLAQLPPQRHPDLIVGTETGDDAAVYRVTPDLGLVATLDFFTPIVDDPFEFGQIACANALSDVYAMGGVPKFALNIVGFPSSRLPLSVLHRILEGSQSKAAEAGCIIAGGHTIDDTEPKYGLAVTGFVPLQKVLSNATAKAGDVLLLTKPIGTGVLTTAMKRGLVQQSSRREAIRVMSTLNAVPIELLSKLPDAAVHACTDVTGFGLLGHLRGMARGSRLNCEIRAAAVPLLPEAFDLAVADVIPGGTRNNLEYVSPDVDFDANVPPASRLLLADAQTSGGLLLSVDESVVELYSRLLREKDTLAAVIGRFTGPGEGRIKVHA